MASKQYVTRNSRKRKCDDTVDMPITVVQKTTQDKLDDLLSEKLEEDKKMELNKSGQELETISSETDVSKFVNGVVSSSSSSSESEEDLTEDQIDKVYGFKVSTKEVAKKHAALADFNIARRQIRSPGTVPSIELTDDEDTNVLSATRNGGQDEDTSSKLGPQEATCSNVLINEASNTSVPCDEKQRCSNGELEDQYVNENATKDGLKKQLIGLIEKEEFQQAHEILSQYLSPKEAEKPVIREDETVRRKCQCPIPGCTSNGVTYLKRHLMSKKHGWDEEKASRAVTDFGLRKKNESQVSDVSKIYVCRICQKPVKKIYNHLSQTHKLPSYKVKDIKKKCRLAVECLKEGVISSSDESSDDESDDDEMYIKKIEEYFGGSALSQVASEPIEDGKDSDWVEKAYFNRNETHAILSNSEEEEELYKDFREALCKGKRRRSKIDQLEVGDTEQKEEKEADPEVEEEEEEIEMTDCTTGGDEESESDVDYEDIEEVFFMSSSMEDKLLDRFCQFLKSKDGGSRDQRQCEKHKRVIQGIVRHKGANVDYTNLYSRPFLNDWVTDRMQVGDLEGGTISTYLGSVQHFFRYLCISEEDGYDFNLIKKFEPVVKAWKRSLWKSVEKRSHIKNLEDLKRFPDSKDIDSIDHSDICKRSKETLTSLASDSRNLTRTSFALVRDRIVTYIIINNATRPCAIENMTLEEFLGADRQKDGYVVSVKKHKVDYKGPAHLALSFDLYKETSQYIMNARNKLPGIDVVDKKRTVFVSWSGNAMSGSLITSRMNNFWSLALGQNPKTRQINPSLLRKFTTTMVHQQRKELAQQTADHLCHSLNVAQKNYRCIDKQQQAASVSKRIQGVQRSAIDLKAFAESEFADEIKAGQIKIADVREKVNSNEKLNEFRGEKELKKIIDYVRFFISKNNSKGAVNKDDIAQKAGEAGDCEIGNVGADNGGEIAGECKAMEDDECKAMEDDECKALEDNECKAMEDESVDQQETVDEKPNVDSIIATTRMRRDFSDNEQGLVLKYLSKYIKNKKLSLNKRMIKDYLATIPEMKDLLETRGVESLIVKIRTERKKR